MAPSTSLKGEIIQGNRANSPDAELKVQAFDDSFQPTTTAAKQHSNNIQLCRSPSSVSISSATSTESLSVLSDDDSDDSDDDDDDSETPTENGSVGDRLSSTGLDDGAARGTGGGNAVADREEGETEFPSDAPQFLPLVHDDNPSRSLSFTVVDGSMVEIVPTDQVESVVSDVSF